MFTPLWMTVFLLSTHPICLNHIHVSVCIIIHLLVNTTDGFKTEIGILILAEQLIDAAEVWQKNRVVWR